MKLTYALFAFAALSMGEGAMFYNGKHYTEHIRNTKAAPWSAFKRIYTPGKLPTMPQVYPKMNVWGGWRPAKRSSLISFEGEKRSFFKHVGNFFKGALGMG